MNEFFKMDVFFVVTTAVVVVLGVLVAYILWRLERVLRHIEHISEQVAKESELLRQDFAGVRNDIRNGKNRFKSLFSLIGKFTKRTSKKP
jgi:hypothetical protein